jgi:hypothetical protein
MTEATNELLEQIRARLEGGSARGAWFRSHSKGAGPDPHEQPTPLRRVEA